MSAPAPIEIGCEAYIVRDGQLLLGLRGPAAYGSGTWGMPGGRLWFMERADEGIIRELKEETGIIVKPADLEFLAATDDPQASAKVHHFHLTFRVDIGGQTPTLLEPQACLEWRWFPLGHLPEALFVPHTRILATIASGRVYH